MKQHQLGNSDLLVSPLTIGCWSFGGDKDDYWGEQNQTEVDRIVDEALDQGVNFFDTAFGYNDGNSEISLGKALTGKRSGAVICNKIPIQKREALPDYAQTIQNSLQRLQTDYIDLMMIHWPTKDEDLLRSNLEALVVEKQKGTIREIGVSNFAVSTLEIVESMGIQVAANEFAYNLISREMEVSVLPHCREHTIGVAAYMPLMQGLLTGKYNNLDAVPSVRKRTIHFDSRIHPLARHGGNGAEDELRVLLKILRSLAAEHNLSETKLAIAWLMAQEGVSTIIAGCRNVEQLRENAAAVETRLDPEVVAKLNKASQPIKEKLAGNLDIWNIGDATRIW